MSDRENYYNYNTTQHARRPLMQLLYFFFKCETVTALGLYFGSDQIQKTVY